MTVPLPGTVQSLGLSFLICTMGTNNKTACLTGDCWAKRCERLPWAINSDCESNTFALTQLGDFRHRMPAYVTEFLGIQWYRKWQITLKRQESEASLGSLNSSNPLYRSKSRTHIPTSPPQEDSQISKQELQYLLWANHHPCPPLASWPSSASLLKYGWPWGGYFSTSPHLICQLDILRKPLPLVGALSEIICLKKCW